MEANRYLEVKKTTQMDISQDEKIPFWILSPAAAPRTKRALSRVSRRRELAVPLYASYGSFFAENGRDDARK